MTVKIITLTVTGADQWTAPAKIVSFFNISITGTWSASVTLQRSFDSGSTWRDVSRWDSNTEEYGLEPERDILYKIGVKSGEYTSGTAELRLSQ